MWFINLVYAWQAVAAPIPGTSSSALVSEKTGQFYSSHGFRLDSGKTSWVQSAPPKKIPSLVTIYKAPTRIDGQQPALTVRIDKLHHALPLKNYVRKWMQDYSRFGFDVLAAKPVKVNETLAFLLDIVSRESKKQLRQIVFVKEKLAVILTCRDQRESFPKTVQDCNQIIRTFQWTSAAE